MCVYIPSSNPTNYPGWEEHPGKAGLEYMKFIELNQHDHIMGYTDHIYMNAACMYM